GKWVELMQHLLNHRFIAIFLFKHRKKLRSRFNTPLQQGGGPFFWLPDNNRLLHLREKIE
ncbi:MAG: hypothetical protein PHP87_11730, partial [Syntrophomonas sp.]|uniref:hypothetical protein n=1 Tax=Syntrophomonas sp. TaxID=2053627 RepID=UPI00260BD5DC